MPVKETGEASGPQGWLPAMKTVVPVGKELGRIRAAAGSDPSFFYRHPTVPECWSRCSELLLKWMHPRWKGWLSRDCGCQRGIRWIALSEQRLQVVATLCHHSSRVFGRNLL